ncbi:bifunctional oligoribonuclease/PAP phosphatase NrnA [Candidatus Parcubacteria bacterium]|nr:bifunctional oligoribonuclease/PAP phosphatase NrnA [Candidatus Parcubacteria bacterium]
MENQKILYKKIFGAIDNAKNIVITSHKNPDGDALGSIFAMSKYLEHCGKEYQIFIDGGMDNNYSLPFLNFDINDNINWKDADLLISLDAGDLNRVGLERAEELLKEKIVINIDHHAANKYFGNINLVESLAASTTEILAQFFNFIGFQIDKNTATALLLGILTDTNNFANKNTTVNSFNIVAYLLDKGANLQKFNHCQYHKNCAAQTLKFSGRIFSALQYNNRYNLAYTVITKKIIKSAEEDGCSGDIDKTIDFFNNLKGSKFAMIFKEYEDNIKVSLRTTDKRLDLTRLAVFFNGGGHKKAAGFSIKGKLKKTASGWKII